MLYVPPWLEIARQECRTGVVEIPGSDHNARILEYGKAVDLIVTTDEIHWCSNFVNFCMEQADIRCTRSARARSWLQWGIPLQVPALGCIAIFQRGRGRQPDKTVIDAPGHVFIMTDLPEPGLIAGIGGNQRDKVCETTYTLDRLLDLRWPG